MKTLKESILKSVKAGKYSIDPTNLKTMDDVVNYANWSFGDKVEVDDKNKCIKIYYNKDVTFIIYFHVGHFKYGRFTYTFLDKNDNVLLNNHILTKDKLLNNTITKDDTLNVCGIDWRCVFDIKQWVETHLKYAKLSLKYAEKENEDPKSIEEYKEIINKIKILQKLL